MQKWSEIYQQHTRLPSEFKVFRYPKFFSMGIRNFQLRENVLNFICMIIGQKGCWRKKICLPLYYSVIKLICHSLCYYVYTIHAVQLFWTIFWNIFFEIKDWNHLIHNLLRCEQYRCIQMSLNMKFHNSPNIDKPVVLLYTFIMYYCKNLR